MIILTETEKNKLRELHKTYSVIQEAMTMSKGTEKDLRDCIVAALKGDDEAGAHLLGWLPFQCKLCMFNRKGTNFNPEVYDRDKNCMLDVQELLQNPSEHDKKGATYFGQFMEIAEEVVTCLEGKGTI